jgi:hypothetical protein
VEISASVGYSLIAFEDSRVMYQNALWLPLIPLRYLITAFEDSRSAYPFFNKSFVILNEAKNLNPIKIHFSPQNPKEPT